MEAPQQALGKKPVIAPAVPVYVMEPVAPLHQEWHGIAQAYERHPNSLQAAWLYLGHHPAFWAITAWLGGFHVVSGRGWYNFIEVGVTSEDEIWVEIMPSRWPDDPTDENYAEAEMEPPTRPLELGAVTFEDAVIAAAALVHETYGNDREFLKIPMQEKWHG